VRFEYACPKSEVSPHPTNRGPKNHIFRPFYNLINGKFNGLYIPNKTGYRELGKCVANYKGSPTSAQNDMNFGPQTA